MVTDEGLNAFEGKSFPIKQLCFNGCTGVTGKGLYHPIWAAQKELRIYEGAYMDQEEMKVSDFGKALGFCFKLESIDVGGCSAMTDDFFNHLGNGEMESDGIKTKPGLLELISIKVNFLVKIMDGSIQKIL
jgi:hypothetical protein